MTITKKTWDVYVQKLHDISQKAYDEYEAYLERIGGFTGNEEEAILYCYGLTTKYGEASSALTCEIYDQILVASGAKVAPSVPARTPSLGELDGVLRNVSEMILPQVASRLVKRTSADTLLNNAMRDGCEVAWVPYGDTCPFCLTLASRGWQPASKKLLRKGHAEHIHANCDCQYAVRYSERDNLKGYDPDEYLDEYNSYKGDINAWRREEYSKDKERINEQRRITYAKKKELESE